MNQQTDAAGTLRGTIDIDSRPGSDACVEIRDLRSPSFVVHCCTDELGTFEVRNLPEGLYEVIARSGIDEVREQVQINPLGMANVTLNLRTRKDANPREQYSVSANQMAAPEKARKAEQKAWEELRKSNFAGARKNAELALQMYPRYADALVLTGILDLHDNQLETSTAELEQAIKYDSGNGIAYIVLASTYNATARFDDALRALSHGIQLRPDMWQAYFESARAEIGKGSFRSAVEHLNRAEKLAKDDFPVIHLQKALALLNLQEFTDGAAELETFLKKEPAGPNAEIARKMLEAARSAATRARK